MYYNAFHGTYYAQLLEVVLNDSVYVLLVKLLTSTSTSYVLLCWVLPNFTYVTSDCKLAVKSDAFHSYGMFHPSGPNLRRYWITPWKKASAHKRRRQIIKGVITLLSSLAIDLLAFHSLYMSALSIPFQISSLIDRVKVLRKLAFSPRGGSFTTFTPDCKSKTGKLRVGIVVSQRRKSLCN